jgi:ABC-type Zn2+ transport system substrate-binding protein/surface adhesin
LPAAWVPSLPCSKISRVEAMLRDNRNSVANNKTDGKAEKFEWLQHIHADQQDQQRKGDIEGKKEVEHDGGNRDDHHHEDAHGGKSHHHIGIAGNQSEKSGIICLLSDFHGVLWGNFGYAGVFAFSMPALGDQSG